MGAFAPSQFLIPAADCAILRPGFAIEFILVGIHAQFWIFPEQRFKRLAPFACLPRALRHHRDETEQLFVRPCIQHTEVVNPRPHVVGMLPCLYLVGAGVINHLGDYLITHVCLYYEWIISSISSSLSVWISSSLRKQANPSNISIASIIKGLSNSRLASSRFVETFHPSTSRIGYAVPK